MAEESTALGYWEAMNHACQLQGCGLYGQAVVFNTTASVTEQQARRALRTLVDTYELLQMNVVTQNGPYNYHFRRRPNLDDIVLECVPLKEKKNWPALASRHDQDSFQDEQRPPWKVLFSPVEEPEDLPPPFSHQSVFIFLLSHCIIDGKGMYDLVSASLMPILSDVLNDTERERGTVPLGKSVEDTFLTDAQRRNPVPWWARLAIRLLRWKTRTFGASSLRSLALVCSDETEDVLKDQENSVLYRPILFTKELSSDILQCAKTNGVTVHTVITAVNLLTLSQTMASEGIKVPPKVQMAWPIDLKRYAKLTTPQPLRPMTAAAFMDFKTKLDITQEEFSKFCKSIHLKIRERSTLEKSTKLMGATRYFLDEAAAGTNLLTMIEEIGLGAYASISNVGVQNAVLADADRPVRLAMAEQYFFLTGVSAMGSIITFHGVATCNGQLMWNVVHSTRNVSQRFSQRWAEMLLLMFQKYCSSQGSAV